MAKLISKTYGDALLELAVEEQKADDFSNQIEQLLMVLDENPEFLTLLNHPRISVEDKVEVVKQVFDGRISEELVGFLITIVTKGRFANIKEILQYFLDQVKELKGIGVVYVTTPLPLEEIQKKAIEDKLLQTTEYKEMEMHYLLEPKLIGGIQIRIGDRVVDSSVSTKILKLQQELLKIQL